MNQWKFTLLSVALWVTMTLAVDVAMEERMTAARLAYKISTAAVMGFVFARLMWFWTKQTVGRISVPLSAEEKILKHGVARDFKTAIGVTGILTLTDRQLIFMPVKITNKNPQCSWPLAEIRDVIERRTWNTFRDGIVVEMTDGEEHPLAVDERRDWIHAIKNEMASHRVLQ